MEERQLILVIDPDSARRDGLAHPLIGQGYRVQVMADGATALEVARIMRPQMILCDGQAPGLDGYSLCRRIQSDARLRFTHFLLVMERSEPFLPTEDAVVPDDILFRPFLDQELTARLRLGLERVALLRQTASLRHELTAFTMAMPSLSVEAGRTTENIPPPPLFTPPGEETQPAEFHAEIPSLRHELNNPLFAISGSAESALARLQILASGGMTGAEELIPRLERILAASERIGQIVRSLGASASHPYPHEEAA